MFLYAFFEKRKLLIIFMKKYIFLGLVFTFLQLLLWQLGKFNFLEFHLLGICENLFRIIDDKNFNILFPLFTVFGIIGCYLISLMYFIVFSEKPFYYLLFVFIISAISFTIFSSYPNTWYFCVSTALVSFLFVWRVQNYLSTHLQINILDMSVKSMNYFFRFTVILLCIFSFCLIKDQTLNIPKPLLNTMISSIEDATAGSSSALMFGNVSSDKQINLDAKLCNNPNIDTDVCLEKLKSFLQSDNINELNLSAETTMGDLVNLKIQQLIAPYQKIMPYVLTVALFSILYPILNILVVLYAIINTILYFILLTARVFKMDVRSTIQEFLK